MTEPLGIAIMHGGPLDGREFPILGRPEGATDDAPRMFAHMEKGFILYYDLREEQEPAPADPMGDIPRYHYDYSHGVPHNSRH